MHSVKSSLSFTDPYDAFEGLRAEECGVLNGCENGRCVRVQEGYTCDCFDGYTLDMSRMACVGEQSKSRFSHEGIRLGFQDVGGISSGLPFRSFQP